MINQGIQGQGSTKAFINSNELVGVESLQFGYENPLYQIKSIGTNNIILGVNSNLNNRLNISYNVIGKDQFINYTGNSGFNIFIGNSNNININTFIKSGFLTQFSTNGSVGNIPKSTVQINNWHPILSNISPSGMSYNNIFNSGISAIGPRDISINSSVIGTMPIQSYGLSYSMTRLPIFCNGQIEPISIQQMFPIDTQLQLSILSNDYSTHNQFYKPGDRITDNITINLKNRYNNNTIITYTTNNLILQGESRSINNNGDNIINLQFKNQ